MELKSEIAFSFYLNQFSVGNFDSDKLDANAVLLNQIVFNTDPYLNYEFSTNNSYVDNILKILNQIKTKDLLEIYSKRIINSYNFGEIMESEKEVDIAILGKERKYYANIESFRKDLNFESCLKVILKAMDKAILCDSDEEFPKEYKKLLEHKKNMDEQNTFYKKSYRNIPKINNSYLADDSSGFEEIRDQREFEAENEKYDLSRKYFENRYED